MLEPEARMKQLELEVEYLYKILQTALDQQRDLSTILNALAEKFMEHNNELKEISKRLGNHWKAITFNQ